ncbi:hypothetical protein LTR99_000888 [Exophiala xenobiotica]|uniref:NADPH-dependent 1-acyldihydroxyacetone phosphate reductase n=1 Tax=Vermiconidia calcicola TaxID=1690605 RepID=A0AAV9QJW0_9PEZI|nr:hypothetical protein LTR99_000888 [Exophiala xenobiotica]KAK5343187.1 hypothetical protein LTR98_000816 [Exophiala xenobiotica]KAK5437414.1 hypothetical protein LTR34_000958 [Exophiala xenobiotica]KAK5540768.1 hypothetical protein LTR23_005999 [Chaetothyriales sp. CCFEE 6169]KAK5545451.1 hypothetical protein LTR25_000458 [Vermiconidia calcicola]
MGQGQPTVAPWQILITGCSDGGLGSALALGLHKTGHFRVFATARNLSKLSDVKAAGIETLSLDVLSTPSIEACVLEVRALTNGTLDMLVNNAGAGSFGALTDTSLSDARTLFDLNVWSGLAVTQAFLPLLLRSQRPGGAVIVNHTSVSSVMASPFIALYGASKAAMAMLTVALRAELRPFGVRVIDLKSGSTKSNIGVNTIRASGTTGFPEKSLYYAARGWLNELYTGAPFEDQAIASDVWAKNVVAQLEKKEPPNTVWVGAFAWTVWFASNFLPSRLAEKLARDVSGVDKVERSIMEYGRAKAIEDAYGKK